MKKALSLLLVALMLLSLTACGKSGEIKKYIQTARTYLEAEDFDSARKVIEGALLANPDDVRLTEMLNTIEEAEKAAIPTEEDVLDRFNEYIDLCEKWFFNPTVNISDAIYRNVTVDYDWGTEELMAHLVIGEAAETKADLDAIFAEYCTEEAYDSLFPPLGYYIDVDGKLCYGIYVGGMEGYTQLYKETATVSKESDKEFSVEYLSINYEGDTATVYECSVFCSRCEDGKFRFGPESSNAANEFIEYDQYALISPGDIYEWPSEDADVKMSLDGNRYEVCCGTKYNGFVYVCGDGFDGWAGDNCLYPSTTNMGLERDFSGGDDEDCYYRNNPMPSNGNSGNNALNNAVQAGVNIAGGILNSIF